MEPITDEDVKIIRLETARLVLGMLQGLICQRDPFTGQIVPLKLDAVGQMHAKLLLQAFQELRY